MNTRLSLRILIQSYGRWALIFAIPLLANILLWHALVAPQRAGVHEARDAQSIAALKPALETLAAQGRALRAKAGQMQFTSQDPSAVMQMVQRLAGRHQVQVTELSSKGQGAQGGEARAAHHMTGFEAMPLELQVTGRFRTLARWLSAVESQPGLQVESWALAPETDAGQGAQLTLTLTAFLRKTS